ncbi:MAG: MBL fold metallo-hydrolase, partial [Bacteroidota bacterium]
MRYFLILILLLPLAVSAQRDWTDIEMEVTKLAPGIHRIFIANSVSAITFHGDEGLMVIDAGYEQSSEKLMEEIRKITDAQLEYLVNTHIHGDHTGGNKLLGKEARQIIAHPSVKEYLSAEQQQGDNIIPPFPDYAIPE